MGGRYERKNGLIFQGGIGAVNAIADGGEHLMKRAVHVRDIGRWRNEFFWSHGGSKNSDLRDEKCELVS